MFIVSKYVLRDSGGLNSRGIRVAHVIHVIVRGGLIQEVFTICALQTVKSILMLRSTGGKYRGVLFTAGLHNMTQHWPIRIWVLILKCQTCLGNNFQFNLKATLDCCRGAKDCSLICLNFNILYLVEFSILRHIQFSRNVMFLDLG